ncbi:MAG: MBL fold metallo-hydrolase [Chloroflexi bacterium]|nr:MBL fold metallo-hydrolase [Chloroflexota bacterium]
MKIKYLGHASFLITSQSGTRIITDPYTVGGQLSYKPIAEAADIVTVSHGHGDHNNSNGIKGNPAVIDSEGSAQTKGIEFKGIPTFHDLAQVKDRGNNIVFCFTIDGINVCHVGDLGHLLNAEQAGEVGRPDVLMVLVGGYYAIGPAEATKLVEQLKPAITIPMHYKNPSCGYPISPVEDFLKGKKAVVRPGSSEVTLHKSDLPSGEILVLEPALGKGA